MKKIFVLLVSIFLASLLVQPAVLADDSNDDRTESSIENSDSHNDDEDTHSGAIMEHHSQSGSLLESTKERKEAVLKKLKAGKLTAIQANRKQAAQNLKDFQTNNGNLLKSVKSELTDEQKTELTGNAQEFKSSMDSLRKQAQTATGSALSDLQDQMKELASKHYQDMKDIVGDNSGALDIIDQRINVFEENQSLREENTQIRKSYASDKTTIVEKYRENFSKRLAGTLDTIPTEKLTQVDTKIDTLLNKYENDATLSEAKKNAIIAQLIAIKSLVEESMSANGIQGDVLDVINSLVK